MSSRSFPKARVRLVRQLKLTKYEMDMLRELINFRISISNVPAAPMPVPTHMVMEQAVKAMKFSDLVFNRINFEARQYVEAGK